MIETFVKNNKLYTKFENLDNWSDNPRNIDDAGFTRLKQQLTLKGQFDPLHVMPDGTVLGGNMRLRALAELRGSDERFNDVWVSIIDFVQEESGAWHPTQDGVEQKDSYSTKESGMLDWAMSHNDDFGWTDSEMLANMMPNYEVDWSTHALSFDAPQTVQDMLDAVAPEKPASEMKYSVLIMCDNDQQQKDVFDRMSAEGFEAQVKTVTKKVKA